MYVYMYTCIYIHIIWLICFMACILFMLFSLLAPTPACRRGS